MNELAARTLLVEGPVRDQEVHGIRRRLFVSICALLMHAELQGAVFVLPA